MSMCLSNMTQSSATFSIVRVGEQDYLECSFFPNDSSHHIAVRALRDLNSGMRQPLIGSKRKKTWCCWRPDWVSCEAVIASQAREMQLYVADLVAKWKISQRDVWNTGPNQYLENLADLVRPQPIEGPPELSRVSTTEAAPADESDEKNSGGTQTLTINAFADEPTDAELEAHFGPSTTRTLRKKSLRQRPPIHGRAKTMDTSKLSSEFIFEKFPLLEVKGLLTRLNETRRGEVALLFRQNWEGIQRLIHNKESWRDLCSTQGAFSHIIRPNANSSLHLEYFFEDDEIWVYFNAGHGSAFALNLTTGKLCERIVIPNKEKAEKLLQLQSLSRKSPYVQRITVSAFKPSLKDSNEIYRILVPYFTSSAGENLPSRAQRDGLVLNWLEGLVALHASGIAGIDRQNLLVEDELNSERMRGVIGGFQDFLTSQPIETITVERDFSKKQPSSAGQPQDLSEAKLADVQRFGLFLKELYADLFGDETDDMPALTTGNSLKEETIRKLIGRMTQKKGDLSAQAALILWKSLFVEEQAE